MVNLKNAFVHKLFRFTILILFAQTISANPVKEETARKIATQFISSFTLLRSEADINLVYTGKKHPQSVLKGDQSASLYYIYNVGEENGFVIVSGEDKAFPILGYAETGSFQTQQMPANLISWLDFYEEELYLASGREEEAATEIKTQWASLLANDPSPGISGMVLPTANWDQDSPYNDLCPKDAQGKTSVVGCVATAMGIAMKYYNWPEKGTGSNSYTTRTDNLEIAASFDVAYDWNNMLTSYTKTLTTPNWNTTQGEAVATLLYHCGVAVNMDYQSSASGAYTPDVLNALENNFGYDKSMSLKSRDLYSADEWSSLIREELDNKRPVIYGGATKDNSGHLFIVDGYSNSGDYFHINWGWSGYSNGYYLLSSLQPSWQGIGGSKEGEGYSYFQDALIGMKKAERGSKINNELYFLPMDFKEYMKDKPKGLFGLYTDVDKIVKNEPFNLYYSYIYDYGSRDFFGELAIVLEDKNNNLKEIIGILSAEEEGLPAGYVYYEEKGLPITIECEVEEGDMLRMYYHPTGYDWRPLRGEPGTITQLPVYADNPTGITQPSREKDIHTEVNNGEFIINFPQDITLQDINIYTIQGQKVMQKSFNSNLSPIITDLSGLENSLYIISIRTSEGLISRKVKLSNP